MALEFLKILERHHCDIFLYLEKLKYTEMTSVMS